MNTPVIDSNTVLKNTGNSDTPFTISITPQSAQSWLSATAATPGPVVANGGTSGITITGNADLLDAATSPYQAAVTIQGNSSSATIAVSFNVSGTKITASPPSVSYSSPIGTLAPFQTLVTVSPALGFSDATVKITPSVKNGSGWLTVDQQQLTTTSTFNVTVNATALPAATYHGSVALQFNGTGAPFVEVDIPVTMTVQSTVPNVAGETQSSATVNIQAQGLVVGAVTVIGSNTVPSGDVMSQSPIAGTVVNPGSAVNLVISSGSSTVTLNDTLVHLADGFQWTTTITLVNLDTVPAPYTLTFRADDGSALALGIAGIGSVSVVNGVLAVNGSTVLQTTGGPMLRQGWAHLDTTQSVGAQAIFKSHIAGQPDSEAAVPIAGASQSFLIAFDNSNGYFTGVALANTSGVSQATVTATFRDSQGNQIGTGGLVLKPHGHVALLLNQSYTFSAGLKGTVEFSSPNSSIVGLGLRFNPTGPFTSTTAFPR